MAKKKKSAPGDSDGGAGNGKAPSTSALIICRNKHWRYISSFHGPWLQLPPEVLESLAHANYLAPRPRPIDAAVFFDLLKIRRHVDDATNLAVRATSGLTSAALSSALGGGGGGGGGGMLG
ncbi:histidine kinase group protein, partial [Stagonosporopsis vannaccii]